MITLSSMNMVPTQNHVVDRSQYEPLTTFEHKLFTGYFGDDQQRKFIKYHSLSLAVVSENSINIKVLSSLCQRTIDISTNEYEP